MSGFHFVESLPRGTTKKEKELQQSKARAHAASISHERAKHRRQALLFPQSPQTLSPRPPIKQALSYPTPKLGRVIPVRSKSESTAAGSGQQTVIWTTTSQAFKDEKTQDSQTGYHHKPTQEIPLIIADYPCYRGLRRDPFNCIPSNHPRVTAETVDFYTQVMIPVFAPVYDIFHVTSIYNTDLIEILYNEDVLYSSIGLIRLVVLLNRNPLADPTEEVLGYLGKAITGLRRRIARPGCYADDLTIFTAMTLAVASRVLGDSASYQTHITSVKQMVIARGGLNKLGHRGLLKCLLIQWEGFWALTSGVSLFPEARIPRITTYPEYPFTESEINLILKSPDGIQTMAYEGKISIDVLELVGRIVDANSKRKSHRPLVDKSQILKLRIREYSDFWEACPCLAAPDTENGPNLEKLLVLTLLVYCNSTFSDRRMNSVMYRASREVLTRDLPKARWKSNEDQACLVWSAAIVVDAWRDQRGKLTPNALTLWSTLRFGLLRDLTRESIDFMAHQFFWDDDVSRNFLTSWEELEAGMIV